MKKVLAVVMASMMVLSLAACGGDKKEETSAPTEATTEAAKDTTEATAEDTTAASTEESKADETQAAAPAGEYVADVNNDGKIIVGYISKNLTDVFHIAINDHAKTTFEQMVRLTPTSRLTMQIPASPRDVISLYSFPLRRMLPIPLWSRWLTLASMCCV